MPTLRQLFGLLKVSPALLLLSGSVCLTFAYEGEESTSVPDAGHSIHGNAYDEGPRQAAYLMEGMPKIVFPVTTTNALAQKFFNQGVGQLHGFWYFEAERSFRQVAMLDTNCVMAQWGMAMANVYNEKRAKEFVGSAVGMTNRVHVTRREQLYIESLAKFYGENKKSETRKADEKKSAGKDDKSGAGASKPGEDAEAKRHREYVRSLEQIIEESPDDIEARAFLTFKIWDNGGRLKISSHMATEALAQQVLAVNPFHPVQHARIHFWNNEADRRALDAAARCGQGSPGIAHMWHMPGHPYSALHRYADAAWQQEASARVDHAYLIKNRVLPDQIHNFAHNNDWLVKNLNHLGRVQEALDLAKNMVELPRHPRYNSITKSSATNSDSNLGDTSVTANKKRENSAVFGRTRLLETLVKWELWDELLALGDTMYLDLTDIPEEQAKRIKALALASFAKGDAATGGQRVIELEAVLKKQRELRHSDTDEAEARARKEKLSDDQVTKAMTDAMQAHADRIRSTEKAIAELRLYEALARGDNKEARKMAEDIRDVPKERLARLWLQLGDKEKAVKLAKEAVEGATNQVQVLANFVDILSRCNQNDEAANQFGRLRNISAQASLDVPLMHRLRPLAKQLNFPDDWRPASQPSTDVGERPPLDSLGPFRWHPSPAPDFKLAGADGKTIALKNFKGRPVLVIFYLGSGCKHCLEQLNAFAPVTKRFADSGVSIVAVSSDSVSGLEKTFKQSADGDGFPFPIVSNESMDVFKQYRAYDDFENMPLHGTFLVDGAGLVRWQDISFEPFTQVEFLLNESQRLLKLPARPTLITSASRPLILAAGLAFNNAHAADVVKPCTLTKCFMSGHEFEDKSVEFDYQGQHVKLCCKDCKAGFDKDPATAMTKLAAARPPFQNVNVEQFEKLRAEKKHTVVDVRTKKEFDAGHIPEAVNIDVNSPDFLEKVAKLGKGKTYLVHCASGGRSVTACKKLAPAGFEHLVNLEGGYKAWEKAGNKGEK